MIKFETYLTEENHVAPVAKIEMLYEKKTSGPSTLFEGVIADCANLSNKSQNAFNKEILKQPYVSRFLPLADKMSGKAGKTAFATKGKTDKEKIDILWKFSQVCKKNLTGKIDAGAGQSKKKVSVPWIEMSEKRGGVDTSKADINVGSFKTSVKGPQAQLMSGEKKETKATVISALQTTKANDELMKTLLNQVDKFVTNTRTVGADIDAGSLKKMSVADAKETGNEVAKKIVDHQEKGKADIRAAFKTAFKNKEVADAFCREAMTGYEKFAGRAFPNRGGGDPKGEATHMLIWDYRMDRMKFTPINNKLISETAPKMKIRPDLKSGSYKLAGKKQGYSFWQTMRIAVSVFLDEQGKIVKGANEEVENNRQMLSEGMMNEGKFKDALKKIYTKVKDKIVGFFQNLMKKIVQIIDRAKEILKEGVHKVLEHFELDVDVRVNTIVSFKV